MDKISYRLVFNRKKKLNAQGKALIQVELYLNKSKVTFRRTFMYFPFNGTIKRRKSFHIRKWKNSTECLTK